MSAMCGFELRYHGCAMSLLPAACAQVTFDEKSPQELLQILNDICAGLDSAHERDIRDEAPEATGVRLLSFLAVLKFPLPPDMYADIRVSCCLHVVSHCFSLALQ